MTNSDGSLAEVAGILAFCLKITSKISNYLLCIFKALKIHLKFRLIALCKMYVNVFILFSSGPYLDTKDRLEYLKWSRLEVSRLLFVKVCQEIV